MNTVSLSKIFSASLLVAGGVSLTALAMGVLDPITKQEGVSYVDPNYLNGGALVSAVERTAGSGSEVSFKLEVTLPAGAGSLTEDAHFIGSIGGDSSLPAQVTLSPSNEKFESISNSPAGTLKIDEFDRIKLKGELLGYPLEALPEARN
jgi:hypothetical protein